MQFQGISTVFGPVNMMVAENEAQQEDCELPVKMVSMIDADAPGDIEPPEGQKLVVIFAASKPELEAVQFRAEEAFWTFLKVKLQVQIP